MPFLDLETLKQIEERKRKEKIPISTAEAARIMSFLKKNCVEKPINLEKLCNKCGVKLYRSHQVFKVLKASPFIKIKFVRGINMIFYEGGEENKETG